MFKPRIVFPFVEAGMGHIMTEKSIVDSFDKKYGEYTTVIRSQFFTETGNKTLIKYEKKSSNEVVKHNKMPVYGFASMTVMDLLGTTISSKFVMEWFVKNSFQEGIKHIEELSPDMVVCTHWNVIHYAKKMKEKPLLVIYVPDSHINAMFRVEADLTLISAKRGYNRAMKFFPSRYNDSNLKLVPFAIRNEAFEVSQDKKEARNKYNFDESAFTIVLAEGGYGIGKMEKICELLLKTDMHLTIIPVCGKNTELYEHFKQLQVPSNISFRPYGFCDHMLELIACADLFIGKSGNIIAEPCFFGVPSIISNCVTQNETNIAKHYIKDVKCAVKCFAPAKCVELVREFIAQPQLLEQYKKNALAYHENFGSEKIADEIWALLKGKYPSLGQEIE